MPEGTKCSQAVRISAMRYLGCCNYQGIIASNIWGYNSPIRLKVILQTLKGKRYQENKFDHIPHNFAPDSVRFETPGKAFVVV